MNKRRSFARSQSWRQRRRSRRFSFKGQYSIHRMPLRKKETTQLFIINWSNQGQKSSRHKQFFRNPHIIGSDIHEMKRSGFQSGACCVIYHKVYQTWHLCQEWTLKFKDYAYIVLNYESLNGDGKARFPCMFHKQARCLIKVDVELKITAIHKQAENRNHSRYFVGAKTLTTSTNKHVCILPR